MVPKALTAFCLVVRRGSIANAAADMNLSQPAVSRLISNLEHELGFDLFHRDKRALHPTDEARRFFHEAERILSGLDQLANIASEIRSGTDRQIRVVSMSRLANSVLPMAAASFRESKPDVLLTLETHHRREMERWLTGRHFDVGFGPLPLDDLKLDVRPLGATQAVVVMPDSHPLGNESIVTLAQLIEEPFVSLTNDTLLQKQIDAAFTFAGFDPRVAIRTSSSLIAVNLVAQGSGYTITDPFTASCANGPVLVRPLASDLPLKFGAVLPFSGKTPLTVEAFITCMKDAFETINARF